MEEKCLHHMQSSFPYATNIYASKNFTLISISESTDKQEMASFLDDCITCLVLKCKNPFGMAYLAKTGTF